MSDWISVEDQLPEFNKKVLVWRGFYDLSFLMENGDWYFREWRPTGIVTDWKELTKPNTEKINDISK